jgi:hypothetical protein
MHAKERAVIPREMTHFSENSYVFVVFDFREVGLWSGIQYLLMERYEKRKKTNT